MGVYKITNTVTNRVYIGASCQIQHRFAEHTYALTNGNHPNEKLKNDSALYGANVFKFEIIRECVKEDLFKLEEYFIRKFNTVEEGYNIQFFNKYPEFKLEDCKPLTDLINEFKRKIY